VSSYEDYSRAAVDYDRSRVAVGADVVLGAAVAAGVSLGAAQVLDAGCGTGAYSQAIAPHVASLTLVDANEGMLAEAEAKLGAAEHVEVRQALLPELPFDDGAFDVVMVHQVLHHLGDEEGDGRDWSGHRAAVAELGRLVAPGGVLVVNTCSQAQLRTGYWYYALVPLAADALRRRYAPLDVLEQAAKATGLESTQRMVPVDAVLQGPSYFDGRSPLDPGWRNGDSAWSLASAEELTAALDQVQQLAATPGGALDAFVAEHDVPRIDVGQLTFLTARRPPA
jgi:ubiquinone/menaquinone biosynthesis C-methylase UbiE